MRLTPEAEEEVAGQNFTAYTGVKVLLEMSVEERCERFTSNQLGMKEMMSILSLEHVDCMWGVPAL